MRTETLGQRIARRRAGFAAVTRSLTNRWRIASLDRAEAYTQPLGPSVAERRHDLVAFYNRYEELVDVICDAAQYGPTSSARGQYLNLQAWMHQHYSVVQPFVTTFLREEHKTDPFIALFCANELDHLLDTDDGSVILQINQTREALNLYAEHLRQLAARTR